MPLVMQVAKSEAIKEKTDTWYVSTDDMPVTHNAEELLDSFPKRARREIKRKLKNYETRGIRTTTEHSDYLSLNKDMPVLMDHERKVVRGTDKSFVEEFIKRFLVIFLSTDGYIDRYYGPDSDKPVALSLFVANGRVL